MRHGIPCSIAIFALAAACGTEPDIDTPAALTAEDGQPLDAEAVLTFLNGPEATEFTLVTEVRVKGRAAGSIVQHVRGEDRTLGTADDDLLQSLEELDGLRYVGTATIRTIDAWLRARGYQPSFEVEGVPFTVDEARAVVELANTATQATLDDDVGLDARAARGIVAARPIATIQLLAEISYVSATALQRMKDWVLTHGVTPPPPVDRTPAVIVSAAATDATHVVVTFSKPLDPATPSSAFLIFISEPDAGILSHDATIAGAVVTVEMEEQEPGMDYTLEVEATVRDTVGIPVDPQAGRWIHFDGFQGATPPPSGEVDCTTLSGGSFDGTSFTAAEECTAVRFLNIARFSEMEQISDVGRRVAYDCSPAGTCGFRASAWQRLAQFADYASVGATALSGLKADSAGWSPSGQRWDTVASVWSARSALVDHPVNLDAVSITRRRADQAGQYLTYRCVELRDQAGAPNFLTACVADVGDTAACGNVSQCLDAMVGTRVAVRGTLRVSAQSTGGYRVTVTGLPTAPNPAVP